MHEERKWFVGIDWASQDHVVTLGDGPGIDAPPGRVCVGNGTYQVCVDQPGDLTLSTMTIHTQSSPLCSATATWSQPAACIVVGRDSDRALLEGVPPATPGFLG